MITEKTRVVNSWQEAVTVLAKNCSLQAQNINDLERMVIKLERKNRVAGIGFLVLGVLAFAWAGEYSNMQKRLDECEKQLRNKQDQTDYTKPYSEYRK